jgi:hypothetical protein
MSLISLIGKYSKCGRLQFRKMTNFIKSHSFEKTFQKTVRGYHLLNKAPIKEIVWENLFARISQIEGAETEHKAGNHLPGSDVKIQDIDTDNMTSFSCKSCKIERNYMKVSSYRMTKCNTIDDFIDEIDVKRANYNFYSLLARKENKKNNEIVSIDYYLYIIPAKLIKASTLQWRIQTNKHTQKITSWVTERKNGVSMSIQKSMSNQLWIELSLDFFAPYLVHSQSVQVDSQKMDYHSLFEAFSSTGFNLS